ncbi:MAG: type III-B CRISPR module RAMP protein Cmr4 [Burkholderiales bacterium]|nr:type III-B CRISPR module RAMP protein Cmr4 [Burkholderiales bacterium]
MPAVTTHYIFHALSPLHFGTGVAVGAIDLPISRETNTRLPNAPGSGIKGVVKDILRGQYGQPDDAKQFRHALGAEPGEQDAERAQGAVSFGDGLLLAFPVRSLAGVFAWVTSPYAIHRLRRFTAACPAAPNVSVGQAVTTAQALMVGPQNGAKKAYLHDLALTVDSDARSTDAARALGDALAALIFPGDAGTPTVDDERKNFARRFAVVSDEDLVHLSTVGCEVRMRNSLELESKRVKDGALWSEEYAPVETIFWGAVMADHINGQDGATTLNRFCRALGSERIAQFGGKATVGKGLARIVIVPAEPSTVMPETVASAGGAAANRNTSPAPTPTPVAARPGIGERVVYPR